MIQKKDFITELIIEGATELLVPKTDHEHGPMSRSTPVFYNPAMRSNRDVSVLYARAFTEKGWSFLDGLGATGIRGLRLYEEVENELEIFINDRSRTAHDVLTQNIERWKRGDRIHSMNKDVNVVLHEKKFDWVDIDPFGTPVPFTDAAIQAVRNNGILSLTATDTAPLCGTHTRACLRKYDARPLRSGCKHEIGLRILVGNVIRRAASLDKAAMPHLCYYSGHYFRCYFTLRKGLRAADQLLQEIGYIVREKGGGYSVSKWPEKGKQFGGPLWLGALFDRGIADNLLKKVDDSISSDTIRFLKHLSEEQTHPPYYYTTDELSNLLKILPPNTKSTVNHLNENGFDASIVHFDTKGFKTDAGWTNLKETILKKHEQK